MACEPVTVRGSSTDKVVVLRVIIRSSIAPLRNVLAPRVGTIVGSGLTGVTVLTGRLESPLGRSARRKRKDGKQEQRQG